MPHFKLLPFFTLLFVLETSCHSSPLDERAMLLNTPAYKSISDSIQQFPKDPELYIRRALLLSAQQLHKDASPDFKKAYELEPKSIYGLAYISNLLDQQKNEEALPLLIEMQKKFPQENMFSRQLAQLYENIGKKKAAEAIFNQLIQSDSNNAILWMEKGSLLLEHQDSLAGIACLEKAYQLQADAVIGLKLASAYQNAMNPKVVGICDELLQKFEVSWVMPDVAMLKGQYYSDKGNYKNALQEFDRCIAFDWKFVDAHIEKGIVHFRMKNYQKALDIFRMASRVSNANADARFWMGRCFEAQGKKEEAIVEYQQSLALDTSLNEATIRIKNLEHP